MAAYHIPSLQIHFLDSSPSNSESSRGPKLAPVHLYSEDLKYRHLIDPSLCEVPGCENKPKSGLNKRCKNHYVKDWKREHSSRGCAEPGCNLKARTRGFCYKHYEVDRVLSECSVEGCINRQKKEGLCSEHFKKEKGTCSWQGCKSVLIKDITSVLCEKHYRKRNRECKKAVIEQQKKRKVDDDQLDVT